MKKIFLILIALLTISFSSEACDKGCTMGGSYFGILPQFHKNFVGMRYTSRDYTITATHGHHTEITKERFTITELWGRFVPVKNVQVFALVPFAFNEQAGSHNTIKSHGFGDVTLLANYSIINTGDSLCHSLKHTLQLGGGVKLATGRHNVKHHEELLPANMQPGTGSND